MRYYAAPDDSGFMALPDKDSIRWGRVPDDWVQIDQAEYEQRLAAARQRAEERSTEFRRQARAPQVDAAQALVGLGLTAEQAAAATGVSVADLEPDSA